MKRNQVYFQIIIIIVMIIGLLLLINIHQMNLSSDQKIALFWFALAIYTVAIRYLVKNMSNNNLTK